MNVALYLLVLNFCICLISTKEEKKNPSAPFDVAGQKSNLRYPNEVSKNVGKNKEAKLTTQDSNFKKGLADINKTQSVNKGGNGIPYFKGKDMTTIDKGYLRPNAPSKGNWSLPNRDTKGKPEKVTDKKEIGEQEKWGRKSSGGQTNPESGTQVNDNNVGMEKRMNIPKKGESDKNEKSKPQASTTPEKKGVTMPVEGDQVRNEGKLHVPNAEQGVTKVNVKGPNEVGSSDKSIKSEKNKSGNSTPQVTDQDALPTEMPIQEKEETTQSNTKRVDAPGYSNGVEPLKGSEPPTSSGGEPKSEASYISEGDPKPEQVEEEKSGNVKNETSKEEEELPSGKEETEESKQNRANQDGNEKDGSSKKDIVKLFHEHIDVASLVRNIKSNEKLQKMSNELVTFGVKAYDGFLVFVERVKFFAKDFVQFIQNM